MSKKPVIHIAFCSDDNYLMPACIMLESFFSCHSDYNVMVHTFSTGLSDDSVKKLRRLIHSHGGRIRMYTVPNELKALLSTAPLPMEYLSESTYYRLVRPYVVSEKVTKLLYLDCDILIRKDVYHYYEKQTGEVFISGVRDHEEEANKKRLGLDKYINAGILVMNTELIRNTFSMTELFDRVGEIIERYQEELFGDQDIINIVFAEHIDILSDYFNYQRGVEKLYIIKHPGEAQSAEIVHFITSDKPWKRSYVLPYSLEYYRYLRKYLSVGERIKWWTGKPEGVLQIINKHRAWKQQSK